MDAALSRAMWHRLEPINAVAYFCAETSDELEALGLKGFWMGYFAARAAPMGRVGPATVEATFFNFHPTVRVGRAVPDCWIYTDPGAVLSARAAAAASSLRRLLGPSAADDLASAVSPVLRSVVEHGSSAGRPLFAANREVDAGDDPVAQVWQLATTVREHRGDGHVAALTGAGLSGVEALVLFSMSEPTDPELLMKSRGWSPEEWAAAMDGLRDRGLVSEAGPLTDRGAELRADIERRTDELAAAPYRQVSSSQLDTLLRDLERAAEAIEASGEIRFPNPMGLPPLRS
jgi:hypothetical protein